MMTTAKMPNTFIINTKVMGKGQVTIPKDVRAVLGLDEGGYVTFIVQDGKVQLVNPAVYAMQIMQREMAGESAKTGLNTEEDVNSLVKEVRREMSARRAAVRGE